MIPYRNIFYGQNIVEHYTTIPGQCIPCPILMVYVENHKLCPGIVYNFQNIAGSNKNNCSKMIYNNKNNKIKQLCLFYN